MLSANIRLFLKFVIKKLLKLAQIVELFLKNIFYASPIVEL